MKSVFSFIAITEMSIAVLLYMMIAFQFSPTVHAQSGAPILLSVQSSLSGCKWPGTAYFPGGIQNAAMICPVLINGTPYLALAINGGSFQIPGWPTGFTCTTATMPKSSGALTASGCTFK